MNATSPARPVKQLWTRAWDTIVDRNPVVAKELLVTARTPMFVASIVMVPLALGAVVLLVRSAAGDLDAIAARQLFTVYFTGLAIALGTVGAGLGSTVIVQEREAGTLEALKFSVLSPSRIVLGKWAAVVLAEAALVVCTLPLLAYVVAVGGASIEQAWVAITIALAGGVMTASVGVAVSAHASNARRSLLSSLVGSGVVGIGLTIWFALASTLGGWSGPFADSRGLDTTFTAECVAVLFILPAYALTAILWLGYAAATSGLMDSSEDRGRPIKRWAVGVGASGMMALFLCSSTVGERARGWIAAASMTAVAMVAAVLLFAFAGEPLRPTRRMRAYPGSRVARILYPSCLAPSVIFTVIACGIVLLSIPALADASIRLEPKALWTIEFLAVLGGSLGCLATWGGATRARRLGALALVCLTLGLVLMRNGSHGPSWVDVLCPLWLDPVWGGRANDVLHFSLIVWGMGALASVAMLLRAVHARPR